jgi:3-deoxy-D-arabino-heptulosonate 7-phosphate (DAHP) synthase class II
LALGLLGDNVLCRPLKAARFLCTYASLLLAQKIRRLRADDPMKNKDLYAESEHVSWIENFYERVRSEVKLRISL